MKSVKTRNAVFAVFAALLCAALIFATALDGGRTFAAADSFSGKNFIYSVELTKESGTQFEIGFGKDGENGFSLKADTSGRVELIKSDADKSSQIKCADCSFGENIKLTLVLNEGVAKVFTGGGVAALVCKAEGYEGGAVALKCDGFRVESERFMSTDTPEGNIFVGGYRVEKVVNLSDGNYKLAQDEYSVKNGVVEIDEDYLKSLDAEGEYLFRVVTSLTDLDFVIENDFVPVAVNSALDKYYRGSDITIELGSGAQVYKLMIDGKEYFDCWDYSDGKVVISSETADTLPLGEHTIKLYTDKADPRLRSR